MSPLVLQIRNLTLQLVYNDLFFVELILAFLVAS